MNWQLYPGNWREISRRVRDEAGDVCEHCGKAQGAETVSGWVVVLTVHHIGVPQSVPLGMPQLPGDPTDKHDCRPENLIALCQSCHLSADAEIRKMGPRYMEGERYRAHAMEATWRIARVKEAGIDGDALEEATGGGGGGDRTAPADS